MDTLNKYRQIATNTLARFTKVQYAYGDIHNESIFDCQADRYMVVSVGWDGAKRIHGCLIHIDIIDGKLWIQRDGTEDGIAGELVEAGILREDIVLAFHPEDVRRYTEYAVA